MQKIIYKILKGLIYFLIFSGVVVAPLIVLEEIFSHNFGSTGYGLATILWLIYLYAYFTMYQKEIERAKKEGREERSEYHKY